jgi:fructan beta-fructosidase
MTGSNERYRPQFHYTTEKGWINDPIGLVFHEGEYHLFNDHNPASCSFPGGRTDGEQSHWSHAISSDLVHWERMPIALYPDSNGACWSGSGVVDHGNTSGFGAGNEPPLVLVYTSAGETFTQSLARSNDRGRTWHKYEGNPVVAQIADGNRDPKVFFHRPTGRWIMVLYVTLGKASFFTSQNLKEWKPVSEVELDGFHECPDMFELPVDSDPAMRKWVLHDARFHYWIGRFDGTTFTPEAGPVQGDFGNNFYAAQSWCGPDDRLVQIGWMCNGEYPDMPFSQQMSFPCELALRTVNGEVQLCRYPVREIGSLYTRVFESDNVTVGPGDNPLPGVRGEFFDIHMKVVPDTDAVFGVRLHGRDVTCTNRVVSCLDRTADISTCHDTVRLRILVDRTSLEVFANDGAVSMSSCFLPKERRTDIEFFVESGRVDMRSLRIAELAPARNPDGTAR